MNSFDGMFHQMLVKAIEEDLATQTSVITARVQAQDDYAYRVGRIHGLRTALQIAEDVRTRLLGGGQ